LHMNIHEGNDTQWTLTTRLVDTPDGASRS
jgi:hypothetical protein